MSKFRISMIMIFVCHFLGLDTAIIKEAEYALFKEST